MTTAHRPTWNPTSGGKDQGGNRVLVPTRQYSSKDLPGHTVLKYRKSGQGTYEEVKRVDFKQDLLNREEMHKEAKRTEEDLEDSEEEQIEESSDHEDQSESQSIPNENPSEEQNDSSSDFSEEELRKEIQKIKAERAEAEKQKREDEEQAVRNKQKEEILKGNPLLDIAPGFSLKRKWTEETIFRNQSRDEPKDRQRFVNDTVRSDFHRKILRKYIL